MPPAKEAVASPALDSAAGHVIGPRSCGPIAFVTPAIVQVFSRRQRQSHRALRRPAAEKRQGTKSREVGHWLAASPMGILISAPTSFAGEGRHAECIGWYRSRGGNA